MKDPIALQSFEKIHQLQSKSFLRYVVEAAAAGVRDEWDRKAKGLAEAWYRDSQGNLGVLERLLAEEDVSPRPIPWPLGFSQYHYCDASYLLGPLKKRMEAHYQEIEAEARNLAGWPAAQAAVKSLLDQERPYVVRAAKLEAQRPQTGPPAQRRKVSANWW
ncbi:MAG: hypothetical protein HY717_16405 [Planctomycetes bacterium]|nr:hypothetical protein [Planctomycetota bacterium]